MYDTIVIGGGTAGLTAAIYLRRANKKVLVIEANVCGGQILNANSIENYPGLYKISGAEYATKLYEQALELGVEIIFEQVLNINEEKKVTTNKNTYEGKTIIVATGSKNRKLSMPKEEKFIGKGISYCATCDGNFFKGKDVTVVGGGDTAIDDALYLSDICNKVYVIVRKDTFKGELNEAEEVMAKQNVEVIFNSTVSELIGDTKLEKIKLNDDREIDISALFVAIGQEPNNYMFKNILDLDEKGYIITNNDVCTKTPGIFVAGDARQKSLRQLVTAASDGAIAATEAIKYIGEMNV